MQKLISKINNFIVFNKYNFLKLKVKFEYS